MALRLFFKLTTLDSKSDKSGAICISIMALASLLDIHVVELRAVVPQNLAFVVLCDFKL